MSVFGQARMSGAVDNVRHIAPRTGVAFELGRRQRLQIIDPQSSQVSDMLAYSRDDVSEMLSNGRTFDYEETIALTVDNRLWSNRSNPMVDIVEDTVGRHDFLLTPCSFAMFRHFYPDMPLRPIDCQIKPGAANV